MACGPTEQGERDNPDNGNRYDNSAAVVIPDFEGRAMEDNRPGALLPCPFCGGTALERGNPNARLARWVNCKGCNADMVGKTLDDAIEKWNRRSWQPAPAHPTRPADAVLNALSDMLAVLEMIVSDQGLHIETDRRARESITAARAAGIKAEG